MILDSSQKLRIILASIVFVGALHVVTIRSGHHWGDDFAMYIHHAKNIAEGKAYSDTGYIYNPQNAVLGPRSYPPVFPLFLAPTYKFFGLDLRPMKLEMVAIFLVVLLTLFFVFREALPFHYLTAAILVLGLNPFFNEFKDHVLSEILFALFLYLSLHHMQQRGQPAMPGKGEFGKTFLLGLLMSLTYSTRTIGIVLIPTLLLGDAIRLRKILNRSSIVIMVLFALFVPIQNFLLRIESSYADQLRVNPKIVLANLLLYSQALSVFWDNGVSKAWRLIMFAGISGLSAVGYLQRARNKITVFEIFAPIYFLAVLLWPDPQGLRFLVPVLPLYVLYCFVGLKRLTWGRVERPAFAALLLAISVTYAGKYSKMNYGPIAEGIGKKETIELFDFIKTRTEANDVFIFRKPRVFSLYTGRDAGVYHGTGDDGELWAYFDKIGATHIIVGPMDETFFRSFVARNKNGLERLYANPDFAVYKISGGSRAIRKD